MARTDGDSLINMEKNPYASRWIAPCSKGFRAHVEHASPARLTKPHIRVGERGSGNFREVSWDEALHYIDDTLDRLKKQSGPASMM
jgi:anaerobic selenocysteine-containing dehydrogenase